MSLEDFQLLDNGPFDNSIMKRDFLKVYHQQGAQLNDADQNIEFIFGENNNFHQIGNAYLDFDITVRTQNAADAFDEDSPIRLTNNGLAYAFQEARLSTSTTDLEHINTKDKFQLLCEFFLPEMAICFHNLIILTKK